MEPIAATEVRGVTNLINTHAALLSLVNGIKHHSVTQKRVELRFGGSRRSRSQRVVEIFTSKF